MKLALPQVMLCAVASVNLEATVSALRHAMELADFGDAALFTHVDLDLSTQGIRVVSIDRITSSHAYSHFMLRDLVEHVSAPHCMIVQWDGFPTHSANWDPAFLDCDYIGAPWPQFTDGHDVGNGGFSLRSRRLMQACRDPRFPAGHPEDLAICRTNRGLLEEQGLRFADKALAARFSRERSGVPGETFGFHGVFNMIDAIGSDAFWTLYDKLDDRTTIWHDLRLLSRQLRREPHGLRRSLRLWSDWGRESIDGLRRR